MIMTGRRTIICILVLFSVSLLPAEVSQRAARFAKEAVGHTQNNDHVKAFRSYVKALITALEDGDDLMAMKCYGSISIIYHNFGDTDNSLYFAHKGYDIARRRGDKAQITFLSNLVTFYSQADDTVNAEKYYSLMRKMLPGANNVVNGYFLIYEQARLERAKKRFAEAAALHVKARRYAVRHGMPAVYVLFQDSELGNLMVAGGKWDDALAMGRRCLSVADSISEKDMMINSYKMMADAFSGLGMKDSAWCYMCKYDKLRGEVYDMPGFFRVQNDITQYKENYTAKRVGRLSAAVIAGLAVIAVFAVLITVLIRKNMSLRKAQRLIIDKNIELDAAAAKDRMLLEKYVAVTGEKGMEEGCPAGGGDYDKGAGRHGPWLTDETQEKLLCRIISVLEDMSVISDPDFSLSAMADKTKSNTKYVSTVINRTYGKNFKTLLNEYRIKEACRRMCDAGYDRFTLKAIAVGVGFRNTVSFIRCFKNVMGMTPSVYQRLSRK